MQCSCTSLVEFKNFFKYAILKAGKGFLRRCLISLLLIHLAAYQFPMTFLPGLPLTCQKKDRKSPTHGINRNGCHCSQHSTTPQRTQTDPSRAAGNREQQGCDRNLLLPQLLRNSVMRARNGERALRRREDGTGPGSSAARRRLGVRAATCAGRKPRAAAPSLQPAEGPGGTPTAAAAVQLRAAGTPRAPGSHGLAPRAAATAPTAPKRDGGGPRAAVVPSAVTSRWAPPAPSRR